MKILFIGCVESSRRLLEKLVKEKKNVVGVITKNKSHFNADFCDLEPLCKNEEIPYHYAKNINDCDNKEFIESLEPDIGFCFGWSELIKKEILEIFPLGVVGFHPAALPCNRGRHPLIWALALGLEETASTFFMITAGADEGDIISQRKILISYEDDAGTLYDKVMNSAIEQEMDIVSKFENGGMQRMPQPVGGGNTWRKRKKADGEIDWRMSSRSIYNLVRSLTKPYVGAHFVYNSVEYKVWKVAEFETEGLENIEPGKILGIRGKEIDVKCGQGGIRLVDFEFVDIKKGEYLS